MIENESPLDLGDIQGNILRGYGFPLAHYAFVSVLVGAEGRKWLSELVDPVTTAEEWIEDKPDVTVNVAVSHAGLCALGVPDDKVSSFSTAFRQGMKSRASELGDIDASDPEHWEIGLGDGQGHVLVMINATGPAALKAEVEALHRRIERAEGGLAIVHEQCAKLLPFAREHFGFSDGFAQPAVEGSGMKPKPGQGTPRRFWGWRSLKPGEFVWGYEDEDGIRPESPVAPLGYNGTYMVYRKLYQDVARFRRFLQERGAHFPGGEELLAAKIVGRWRDGTPLVRSPDRPDARISRDKNRINDFRFRGDREGHECPLGAHVRRTNPRDTMVGGGKRVSRHRIIRRGMPYGEPLAEGRTDDDREPRGLVFVCFNASIERQFETIQSRWCSDGDVFGLAGDRDFLLGGPSQGKMTVQGRSPSFLSPQQPFVVTKGGEYLFVPGLDALRALAAGWPAAS
ncbi:MAG: Dyp-type peroxidase [Acidimicrobiales bacterium]